MNEGVEWALHTCLNLSWVDQDVALPAAKLAALYDLPAAYLNKQLQALVRAGILASVSGPRGGFRLARRPEDITVLDVVVAVDGPDDAFRCTQILRHGPGGSDAINYREHCLVSRTMRAAELTWRRELAGQTIADIRTGVERDAPLARDRVRRALQT